MIRAKDDDKTFCMAGGFADDTGAIKPSLRDDFFQSSKLKSLQVRALTYLDAGVPVHFRGPAGTGKTALAFQIAAAIGRPTAILSGDNWLTSADLLGNHQGTRTKQVVDRYVHSVQRTETESEQVFVDNVLTRAITLGQTLIYDEFTRSSPEANNPLLAALEERMIVVPGPGGLPRYVHAHKDFRAILTSNPDDYAGVSQPQDALIDRMITLDVSHHDRNTEIGIVMKQTSLNAVEATHIVDIVADMRAANVCGQAPSLRASIMIAKVVRTAGLTPAPTDPGFVQLCFDILKSKAPKGPNASDAQDAFHQQLVQAIKRADVTDTQNDPISSPSPVSKTHLKEAS